jgi:hypothetical protein
MNMAHTELGPRGAKFNLSSTYFLELALASCAFTLSRNCSSRSAKPSAGHGVCCGEIHRLGRKNMRGTGTAHDATKTELVKEISALKTQLKRLSAAAEAEANSGVSRTLSAIETKSREAMNSAIEAAQEYIDEYADSASDAAAALSKKSAQLGDAATDSLVEVIQARPLSTLFGVIGLGFVAGYLCRRN